MVNSEYQPTPEETLFLKYYEALIKETTYARSHLKIWEQLIDCSDKYIHELNQAPHFFRFTIKSHLDDAILTLSRIIDETEGSLSIWKFLNYVEQHIKIFSTQAFKCHIKENKFKDELVKTHTPIALFNIKNDREKLDDIKQILKAIKKWRDKRLAHFDRRFHLRNQNITLKRQQIQNVVDKVASILNRYSHAYNASSWSTKFVGEDDFKGVINAIRFQREGAKKQLEALTK